VELRMIGEGMDMGAVQRLPFTVELRAGCADMIRVPS
jgi:hypothetical protein